MSVQLGVDRRWRVRAGLESSCATAASTYQLDVYRTSPGTYRVKHGASVADLAVERLDEYERRIVCGGRSYRVLAVTEHAGFRIEVDGKAHQVFRDDGGVVRAGWPAFVVSVLVQPGDDVVANTPIAVLESMKMESTVVAPFAGEVASVAVVANAQVDAGAPLVRIRASGMTALAVPVTGSVDLSGLDGPPCRGDPTLRESVRCVAQLPPRLRPRPGHPRSTVRRAASVGRARTAR